MPPLEVHGGAQVQRESDQDGIQARGWGRAAPPPVPTLGTDARKGGQGHPRRRAGQSSGGSHEGGRGSVWAVAAVQVSTLALQVGSLPRFMRSRPCPLPIAQPLSLLATQVSALERQAQVRGRWPSHWLALPSICSNAGGKHEGAARKRGMPHPPSRGAGSRGQVSERLPKSPSSLVWAAGWLLLPSQPAVCASGIGGLTLPPTRPHVMASIHVSGRHGRRTGRGGTCTCPEDGRRMGWDGMGGGPRCCSHGSGSGGFAVPVDGSPGLLRAPCRCHVAPPASHPRWRRHACCQPTGAGGWSRGGRLLVVLEGDPSQPKA